MDELVSIVKEWKKDLEQIDKKQPFEKIILECRKATKKMWKTNGFCQKFIKLRKEVYQKCQQQLEEK